MQNHLLVKTVIYLFVAGLFSLGIQHSAYASMIATNDLISAQQRNDQIGNITTILSQEDVRSQLVALGVDPDAATARIASLSDAELQNLDDQLQNLSAGGDSFLSVLGIIFLVLLVLELTGVIDIFKKT